ncbi:Isochorismatase-like [Methylophilaceae bacterium]
MQPNLLKVDLSQLVIVDVQTRLIGVMPEAEMAACLKQSGILAQAAALLAVPVILTEQYPKGLGHTDPALMAQLTGVTPVEKTTFSCMAEAKVRRQLSRDRSQIVLAGMEAHICILQTAMDLVAMGKQVYVAEDAIISRQPANKANAIARMREAGCIISNSESIVFEWLGKAEGDAFKAISLLVR